MSLSSFAAAQLLRALPRVRISRAVGRLCDRNLPAHVSRPLFRAYCRAYGVNLEEAEAEARAAGYASFNAFFTRTLRQGARQISEDRLVSPADGRLSAAGRIDEGSRLFVKGQPYDVAELTGDSSDLARYSGGQFAVVYLAPGDYHRVHSPADGMVSFVRGIPGDLYPVNNIGERHVPRLFVRNSRVTIGIDTEDLGRIALVLVGAVIVGRISVAGIEAPDVPEGLYTFQPPRVVSRGTEVGIFHLGSTAVVLVGAGVTIARPLGKIRYGDSLLRSG